MSNLATIVNNILADSGIDDINVVVTTGSYSNPAWITALSWTKITDRPTTLAGYGITDAVPSSRTITINGTAQDLSANRTFNVGTVTSVAALTLGTTGTDLSSTVANSTTTPVITLNVPTASAANRGALSAADWTTFNNKQNALTNPVTGTGDANYLPKFTGASTIGNSLLSDNGTNIGLGIANPTAGRLQINVSDTTTAAHFQVVDGTTTLANSFVTNFRNANDGNGRYSLSRWQVQNAVGNDQFGFIGVQSITGAGAYSPNIVFGQRTGVSTYATRMTLDSSGNLGLGVTPSAWNSAYKAFQFGTTGALFGESGDAANYFTTNTFVDSVGFKYITSDWALGYFQENGVHSWRTAPSQSAGTAITFTQAMTLGSNSGLSIGTPSAAPSQGLLVHGNVGIGASPVSKFEISSFANTYLTAPAITLTDTSGDANSNRWIIGNIATDYGSFNIASAPTPTSTTFTPRLTILRGGNVGIGTASPVYKLVVSNSGALGFEVDPTSGSGGVVSLLTYNRSVGAYKPLQINSEDIRFQTGLVSEERMRIFSDGNVSISNAPSNAGFKLDVNGTGRFNSTSSTPFLINTNTDNTTTIRTSNGGGNAYISFENSGDANNAFAIGRSNSGDFVLNHSASSVYGGGTLTNYLNIASTGAATFSSSVTANGNIISSNTSGQAGLIGISGSQAGAKNYIITNVIPGETNTGLAIRNTTDARNDLSFSGTGLATFTSSVTTVATFNSTFGQSAINFANSGISFGSIGSGSNMTPTAGVNDVGIGTAGLNNSIVFATGTGFTERMRITSGGNVLINKTSDNGTKFQVNGALWSNEGLYLEGTDAFIWQLANSSLRFATNSTERMRITSSGRVLIGTPPPAESTFQLDVNGTGRFATSITSPDVFATFSSGGYVSLRAGGAGAAGYMEIYSNNGTTRLGYIGYNTANISYTAENGARHEFTGAATFSGSVTTSFGQFLAQPSTGTNSAFSGYLNDGGQLYVGIDNSAGSSFGKGAYAYNFFGNANRPMVFSTDNTTRFTIAGTGEATFSSSVTAGGLLTTAYASAGSSMGQFILNTAGSTLNNSSDIYFGTWGGSTIAGITNARISALNVNAGNAATDLLFYTWNGSSSGERMRITSGGNTELYGNLSLRASATGSTATHVPVFIADPASTTRSLLTRTLQDFKFDVGSFIAKGVRSNAGDFTRTLDSVNDYSLWQDNFDWDASYNRSKVIIEAQTTGNINSSNTADKQLTIGWGISSDTNFNGDDYCTVNVPLGTGAVDYNVIINGTITITSNSELKMVIRVQIASGNVIEQNVMRMANVTAAGAMLNAAKNIAFTGKMNVTGTHTWSQRQTYLRLN
jgi:hypothetical protein